MPDEQGEVEQTPQAAQKEPTVTRLPDVDAERVRAELGDLRWDTPDATHTSTEIGGVGGVSFGRKAKKHRSPY